MTKVFLETSRLILRQLTEADFDNLVELDSDPEVMRFINGGVATSLEAIAEKFLPEILSYYDLYENLGFWAVIEKTSQEFIGWVILRPESRFKIAQLLGVVEPDAIEIGYRLRRASWGQGYATEAAQSLVNKSRKHWPDHKIVAWALPENRASVNVMEKLGLVLSNEYILTEADVLLDLDLLNSETIQNLLGKTIVKYSSQVSSE